ncbi:hypothetical protein [Ramlibacter humi]|uniref:Uncharacterized protein n=1 Tax=Ramlibacter humi TaxID=2530451 RepID=A0A4Z0C0N5_9BURK|nr:hypothetical protein [Ramlibacter humi]TFZ04080.1 hypothetical protein EZ216_10625 [Ramlibacter humi]
MYEWLVEAEELRRRLQSLTIRGRSVLEQAEQKTAEVLAEKWVLRKELARYAPDHPLVRNHGLQEARAYGAFAYTVTRNRDDALDVPRDLLPPAAPPN